MAWYLFGLFKWWTWHDSICLFLMIIVSSKIYDNRDDFDFEIVNFPFLDVMSLALHPMESISLNSFIC